MAFHFLFSAFSSDGVMPSETEDRANAPRVLKAVVAELDFALIATAVTASLVTARAMLRPLSPQYSALSYLPPDPALLSNAAMHVTGLNLPRSFKSASNDFYASLAVAKAATVEIQTAQDQTTAASGKDWMSLSGEWRRSAALALTAGDEAHDLSSAGADQVLGHWPELRLLLAAVRDGDSPCVSTDGHIVCPSWADRRGSQRKTLGMPAWHCAGERKRRVTLADISQTGFGLSDCSGITAGDHVAVEMTSGRVLSGVVMWARADRAGVRLRQPLTRNDILLG